MRHAIIWVRLLSNFTLHIIIIEFSLELLDTNMENIFMNVRYMIWFYINFINEVTKSFVNERFRKAVYQILIEQ